MVTTIKHKRVKIDNKPSSSSPPGFPDTKTAPPPPGLDRVVKIEMKPIPLAKTNSTVTEPLPSSSKELKIQMKPIPLAKTDSTVTEPLLSSSKELDLSAICSPLNSPTPSEELEFDMSDLSLPSPVAPSPKDPTNLDLSLELPPPQLMDTDNLEEGPRILRSVVVIPKRTTDTQNLEAMKKERMLVRKRSNEHNLGEFKLFQQFKLEEKLKDLQNSTPAPKNNSTRFRVEKCLRDRAWDAPFRGSQPRLNKNLRNQFGKNYKKPTGGCKPYFNTKRVKEVQAKAESVLQEIRRLVITGPAELGSRLLQIHKDLIIWRTDWSSSICDDIYGRYLEGDLPDVVRNKDWRGQNGIKIKLKMMIRWKMSGLMNILENASKALTDGRGGDLRNRTYDDVWQILDLAPTAAWFAGNITTDISLDQQ